ncbi:MAG: hypothetical protein E7655_00370 [Ruminococcaceae bacterium]|nr:hypothetical protein [Oscillospiraceae bacterium]
MTKELLLFLRGKTAFSLDASDRTRLADALLRCAVVRTLPKIRGERIVFFTARRDGPHMASFLEKKGLAFACEQRGLPAIASRYRRRYGLFLGAFLFASLLAFSTLFLWSAEVSGNKLLTDDEVLAQLSEAGFGVGSFLPRVDYDQVNHRLLIASEDIAWLGIEVSGTHAVVTVRERIKKQASDASSEVRAANLVSNADGQIFYTTVYGGTTVVNPGDSVKKGDLLVSGFCEKEDGSFTLKRASGKVFAYVTRTLSVEVPFEQAEKVKTGESIAEYAVNIFGKSIKILQKGGKTPPKYDIIKSKTTVTVFGAVKLPLSLDETLKDGYEYRIRTLSKQEAAELAEQRFENRISALSNTFDILEITRTPYETDYGVGIAAEVYGIENIARMQEIDTEQP